MSCHNLFYYSNYTSYKVIIIQYRTKVYGNSNKTSTIFLHALTMLYVYSCFSTINPFEITHLKLRFKQKRIGWAILDMNIIECSHERRG